jgi:alpha-tubulin suppressor-like RCC1 family protein
MTRSRPVSLLLALLLLAACSDQPIGPAGERVPLRVTANVSGTTIGTLVVTVSAADIPSPLVFNLQIAGGVAAGTLHVPPGTRRTFAAQAFDAAGEVTHEGSVVADVLRGPNPPRSITLLPVTGGVPVTVSFGSVSVVVTPAQVQLELGAQVQLTVSITDEHGAPVQGAAAVWASANPARAQVDAAGVVTALTPGEVQVMATYAGMGGSSMITVTVPELLPETISAGFQHSCGLMATGAAYCWGANAWGQLGDGTRASRDVPTAVAGGHAFRQISAGYDHTVAVTHAGVAYAWGRGLSGQLGHGAWAPSDVPVAVAGGHAFRQVSAGIRHTVGITSGGAAYAWGNDDFGQLGVGGGGESAEARNVPTPVLGGHTFRQVAAGPYHTVAITTGGAAYGWGSNVDGQLGNGTTSRASVPVRASGSHVFREIATGWFHTVALTMGGAAHAWGRNEEAQLGNGTLAPRLVPFPVSGGVVFSQVSAGGVHSLAVTPTGEAYAWGDNSHGQLGDGTFTRRTGPTAVSGVLVFGQARAGGHHTLAVNPAGTAYAWGRNYEGQGGDGTVIDRNQPVPVSGGVLFQP